MRRVILIVSIALLIFGLTGHSNLLADGGEEACTSLQNGTTGDSAQDQAGSDSAEPAGLLQNLLDALLGLVGADSHDPEDPLQNVHPPDYNPPTLGGDDGGWEDQNK
ncbi:MAG: hypothetical protein KKG33_10540 [candidate division Zixibacteria bacterium]|nr:hypothetical protein [candidate division Zixibacteria bacterium]MBU1469104.1 hypothetical protein [candidate division Zixibacteria bacterium]MBU2625984.1 hypothetical protein [candidate division Zixibacteria bacterium]